MLNNGEIVAAILAAGAFNKLSNDGKPTLGTKEGAGKIVEFYGQVLNKLKEDQPEIFFPDHSK